MICLDNDVFSRYASRQSYPAVSEYLTAHRTESWLLPSIVLFEYLQRYSSHNPIQDERRTAEQAVDDVVAVDVAVAEEAANIRARLAATETSLDVADLLVAACARERGATLVTRNKHDFDKRSVHELVDVDIIY